MHRQAKNWPAGYYYYYHFQALAVDETYHPLSQHFWLVPNLIACGQEGLVQSLC